MATSVRRPLLFTSDSSKDPEFAARALSLCPWRGKLNPEEADQQAREVGRELRSQWSPEAKAFIKIVATVFDEEGADALPPPMEVVKAAKAKVALARNMNRV